MRPGRLRLPVNAYASSISKPSASALHDPLVRRVLAAVPPGAARSHVAEGPTSCPVPSAVVPGQPCPFAQNRSCPTSIPFEACDGGSTGFNVSCSCIYGTWTCHEYPIGCGTPASDDG
jgi:hypothetical protein